MAPHHSWQREETARREEGEMMKSSRESTGEGGERVMEGRRRRRRWDRLEAAGRENARGTKKINWMKREERRKANSA